MLSQSVPLDCLLIRFSALSSRIERCLISEVLGLCLCSPQGPSGGGRRRCPPPFAAAAHRRRCRTSLPLPRHSMHRAIQAVGHSLGISGWRPSVRPFPHGSPILAASDRRLVRAASDVQLGVKRRPFKHLTALQIHPSQSQVAAAHETTRSPGQFGLCSSWLKSHPHPVGQPRLSCHGRHGAERGTGLGLDGRA